MRFHTRKPVAAAQNPPTIQKTFFIALLPLSRSDFELPGGAMRFLNSSMHFRGLDAAKFCCVADWVEAIAGVAGTTTLWVWIRFDSDGCWELERV